MANFGTRTDHIDYNGSQRLLRLKDIIGENGCLPISRSTWYARIRSGDYPPPIKLGERISAWRLKDVISIVENASRYGEA